MQLRSATIALMFSAAAFLIPSVLPAQFTTFVARPLKAAADSAKTPVAVAKARADSASRMTLTDMKTWVDSAAGTTKPAASVVDSALASAETVAPTPSNAASRTTTTFSNGAIAPNTATQLPTVLTAGLAIFAAGMLLFRFRRRRT